VPGRHPRVVVTVALVAAVLVIGAIAFRVASASQAEDPAMTGPALQQPEAQARVPVSVPEPGTPALA
jgi:hypothetical protein